MYSLTYFHHKKQWNALAYGSARSRLRAGPKGVPIWRIACSNLKLAKSRKGPDMRTIDDMIRQEVHYCVSGLVSTLAQGSAMAFKAEGSKELEAQKELSCLCDQASDLAAPVDDWEEAAIQEGWEAYHDEYGVACWRKPDGGNGPMITWTGNAESLCRAFAEIDSYQREIYEHWIVSDWFAKKLTQHGEKVDMDFAGLTVWARTTTGQAISQDGVVQRIYQEASK